MRELVGKWNYLSFTSFAAVVDRSTNPPDVKRPALLAGPWTPHSIMEFATDSVGNVTGSARFGSLDFTIIGSITPPSDGIPERAANPLPEGIELVVTVPKTGTVYNLRGYFLPDSDHIVGTVLVVSNDLGFQSVGTSGPFVLYPVKS